MSGTDPAPPRRMVPALGKRFRSGRPCLDFAHTAGPRELAEPELILDAASLQRWLGHVLGVDGVRALAGDVARAHRLRTAILRVARARATGAGLDAEDIQTINNFADAATPVPQLGVYGTLELSPRVTVAAALSVLARDVIDLVTGPLGSRIRVCAAEGCAFLFVDASRPGTRRWCSMQRCGNLAKVRTHRGTQGR
ncbi:ABATE domain-containing protein [Nakamurella sp. A5-74]|uniref:ABATE domain-containing protein n=1 Tax=Nakamurella sp. A5-74 TaxID=3158264 RepID=A0AAU8DLY3_9ACTN